MKKAIIVLLGVALGFCSAQAQELTKENFKPTGSQDYDEAVNRFLNGIEPKIVGGKKAADGAYPWQVTLLVKGIPNTHQAHFCGGSIYNSQRIVTAAHCLIGVSPNQFEVAAGTNILNQTVKRHKVARRIIHADYGKAKRFDSDIALVQLAEPMKLNDRQMAIALLTSDQEGQVYVDPNDLIVTGWGATEEGGSKVRDLREVTVPFVSAKRCTDPLSYGDRVTDKMVCAGEPQKDSCQGDSGGPLITVAPKDKVRLAGIVSWGDGCARPGKYGIYTRVRAFTGWVAACVSGAACSELK
ncbi:serine protease [Bradyrhizobium icense]|uniref:Peptidase S1 domain-containing protein n=1 Tax=Bradyrhizobium icense TaxID=1274631 RepID=A0A1B1UBY0_9BRAD|nr:serine protease [Bradyrhizobium icense]ANW00176.1 hypothetical protein LMTR13_08280 [Bradyrhizobium icense]